MQSRDNEGDNKQPETNELVDLEARVPGVRYTTILQYEQQANPSTEPQNNSQCIKVARVLSLW